MSPRKELHTKIAASVNRGFYHASQDDNTTWQHHLHGVGFRGMKDAKLNKLFKECHEFLRFERTSEARQHVIGDSLHEEDSEKAGAPRNYCMML